MIWLLGDNSADVIIPRKNHVNYLLQMVWEEVVVTSHVNGK
jgi:hypothetical protein